MFKEMSNNELRIWIDTSTERDSYFEAACLEWNNRESSLFEDFGVVYAYTRKQAIEDGVLIDLNKVCPEVTKDLFKFPVACTDAVWKIIDQAINNKAFHNDLNGVVWDILYMSIRGIIKQFDDSTHIFGVIITGARHNKYYTLKAVCGPNDDLSPCITIMLPEED